MSKLKNKIAVITGGNSGIGFGIAEAFKKEGVTGTITGRNQETLDRLYAAAKAAIISLAKGLSLDLLERKIRVNTLSPGSIDTPAFDKLVPQELVEQVKQAWTDLIPVNRMGHPADIGNAAVFLASDDSSFTVGTEILSDGGMTNISLMK